MGPLAGLSQYQDYQALNMLPTGNGNYYEATIPTEDIDPRFDFMYLFEVMDNVGNGKIYPDMADETSYIVVKVNQRLGSPLNATAPNPKK